MIRDHPVAGIGLNMFPYVVQTKYPYSHDNDVLMPHAHNLYLQTGVEYGLPGLACFAALVGVACAGLIRSLRSARFGRALPLGIGGALVAYLNFGLLDTVAVGAKPTFLAWTVLALAVSSGWPASEPSATQVPAMVPFRSG
jgi:O-antigen ligase